MCGKMTGLIIFSVRWEMASWPMLFDASLRIAKVVLWLLVSLKLKGVMFGAGGEGVVELRQGLLECVVGVYLQ